MINFVISRQWAYVHTDKWNKIDRQIDGHMDKRTDRQADALTYEQFTYRHIDGFSYGYTDKKTDEHANMCTDGRWTDRWTF